MTLKSMAIAAAPIVLAVVVTGIVLYFGGNQPGLKQAQKGFSGMVSPTAPAAFF